MNRARILQANDNFVVVVGMPAAGKTWLTERISGGFKVYHTDDYIQHGFQQSLYMLMDDLRHDVSPRIMVEGVQGYRLLRKIAEERKKEPDLVVVCVADNDTRRARYADRGKVLEAGMDRMLSKIWHEYLEVIAMQDRVTITRYVIYDTLNDKIMQS